MRDGEDGFGRGPTILGPPRAIPCKMKQLLLLALTGSLSAWAADVCNPREFQGTYGFQLSGETKISGSLKPSAGVGSLVFHWESDSKGSVTGYSSTHFSGFLQGNPVTGSYEAHTDCSLTWTMQDDSGNYQHFAGTMTPDFQRVQFRQTDPGGPDRGLMILTPKSCGVGALLPRYRFAISGSYTPMEAGQEAHRISASGIVDVAAGSVRVTSAGKSASGTMEIDGDCVVQMDLNLPLPDSDATTPVKIRGILVDEGRQILGIQTDPGATVIARFTVTQP